MYIFIYRYILYPCRCIGTCVFFSPWHYHVGNHSPTQCPLSAHHGFSLARDLFHNGRSTLISLCLHICSWRDREKTSHSRWHISLPRVMWLYYNANSNSLGFLQCVYYKILYLTTIYIYILLTHNQYTWILSLNIFPTLYGYFSDVQISHMAARCGRGVTDVVT